MLKVANSVISASRITGVLPVLNGGTGVTTSTGTGNTVLSATPTLSGDVTLSTGNLVIGTAGKGIDFSATSSGSGAMTSELLADYEEGTWIPTITFGGAAVGVTYGANAGTYTRIGNVVTGRFIVGLSSKGSSSGSAVISGLPFTVNASNLGSAVVELALNFNVAMVSSGFCGDNTTTISLFTWGPTGMSAATDLNFANNTRLDMWIQYNI